MESQIANNISWVTSVILPGVVVFISTNLDDLFLLMFLFSQVDQSFKKQHIILGQYLGFAVIIAASTLGFLGKLLTHLPLEWLGFLGLIPTIMGIRGIIKLFHRSKVVADNDVKDKALQNEFYSHSLVYKVLAPFLSLQTYSVAAMTVGNGTDNIGAYAPLFAHLSSANLIMIITIYLVLISIWCYMGYTLIHFPLVSHFIDIYGHILMPILYLIVGIFVMYESGTLNLLLSIRV